jgi:hypothetical protein
MWVRIGTSHSLVNLDSVKLIRVRVSSGGTKFLRFEYGDDSVSEYEMVNPDLFDELAYFMGFFSKANEPRVLNLGNEREALKTHFEIEY